MSFFSIFNGVERLDMAEADSRAAGYWVDVKRSLSRKDNAAVSRALMSQKMSSLLDKEGEVVSSEIAGDFDPEEASRLRVRAAVVAWNFDDDNGQPIPVTDEAVDGLPSPVFNFINTEVTKMNNPKRVAKDAFRSADPATTPGA